MSILLTTGCVLSCSMGTAPSDFMVPPRPGNPAASGFAAAVVTDIMPGLNIKPFLLCNSEANPMTIAATAAAQGVKTPGACTPVVPAPWAPASMVTSYAGVPLATISSKCACAYGGTISVTTAAQTMVTAD